MTCACDCNPHCGCECHRLTLRNPVADFLDRAEAEWHLDYRFSKSPAPVAFVWLREFAAKEGE